MIINFMERAITSEVSSALGQFPNQGAFMRTPHRSVRTTLFLWCPKPQRITGDAQNIPVERRFPC